MPTFPPTETVISGLSIDRNFPTLKKFFFVYYKVSDKSFERKHPRFKKRWEWE